MMEHPSAYRLEALVTGAVDDDALTHAAGCDECRQYLDEVRSLVGEGKSEFEIEAFLRQDALASSFSAPRESRASPRFPIDPWLRLAVPIALAAGLSLVLYSSSGDRPFDLPGPPTASPVGEMSFKGAPRATLIIDRDGRQFEAAGTVPLKAGDRFRVALETGAAVTLAVVVVESDGTITTLSTDTDYPPGRHLLDGDALRVGETPLRGRILVGPSAAIARVRAGAIEKSVTTVTLVPMDEQDPPR